MRMSLSAWTAVMAFVVIILPRDPPKPTGIALFKYVLSPPFSLSYVSTGFLTTKTISSVIPADCIYANPELRSLVEQERVIPTYRSVKVDLIFTTKGLIGLGTTEDQSASLSYVMALFDRIAISASFQGPARDLA
jgi:hypothetical protein